MPQNILFPDTTVIKTPASTEVLNTEQRVLFVGQQVAAGTATSGQLYTEIGNDNSWDTLFGAKSMLAAGIRAGRVENGVTRFDAIPLDDDGAAVDSTAVVTFGGGPATGAGTITVYLGSKTDYIYALSVADTDAITAIGAALETAINADTNAPFTALNAAGVVTITAANGGLEANSFLVKHTGSAPSITVALTGWTGGATNPTLTSIFDVIGEERYQTIIWPGSYLTTEVETLLDGRWNADGQILDGAAVLAINDSLANVKTKANALNSQSLVIVAGKAEDETDYKGGSVPELDYVIAAKAGAIRALRLTQDANIANYVTTNSAKDQIGGPSIATLPYANTPINSIATVEIGKGWKRTEINEIIDAGGCVIGNNRNDTNIISGQMTTTYKTDDAANPDPTYKYLNYVDTASNVAEYFYNNAVADFSQTRLTSGSLKQGFDINNERSIRARFVKYYQDLTGEIYLLLQGSPEALTFFKDNLSISINLVTGTATASCKVPIITQLRILIVPMQIAFDIAV